MSETVGTDCLLQNEIIVGSEKKRKVLKRGFLNTS